MLYLDSSAMAKLYVAERGSEAVEALALQNAGSMQTSIVTYAEVLSVLTRYWREKRLTTERYHRYRRLLRTEWQTLSVVDVTFPVLQPAERLIERHGLRGFDAVHLCSALWVGRPMFACFDERLRQAARAEGLTVAP